MEGGRDEPGPVLLSLEEAKRRLAIRFLIGGETVARVIRAGRTDDVRQFRGQDAVSLGVERAVVIRAAGRRLRAQTDHDARSALEQAFELGGEVTVGDRVVAQIDAVDADQVARRRGQELVRRDAP